MSAMCRHFLDALDAKRHHTKSFDASQSPSTATKTHTNFWTTLTVGRKGRAPEPLCFSTTRSTQRHLCRLADCFPIRRDTLSIGVPFPSHRNDLYRRPLLPFAALPTFLL